MKNYNKYSTLFKKSSENRRKSYLSNLLDETCVAYYWIGFLLADGCFNLKASRLKFCLAPKDKEQVERFYNFIKSKTKIQVTKISVAVSAQNKEILPLICKKFDIKTRKTYNPPKNISNIKDKNLLLSLIIGYIDGDGNIKKLHKRKDFCIRLKAHCSWIEIFKYFENKLYKILKIEKRKNKIFSKINKQGYASLCFSDTRISKALKKKAIELKLPVLKRKWDNINLEFTSRAELGDKHKKDILKLYEKDKLSINQISKKLHLKRGGVYCVVYRKNGRVENRRLKNE